MPAENKVADRKPVESRTAKQWQPSSQQSSPLIQTVNTTEPTPFKPASAQLVHAPAIATPPKHVRKPIIVTTMGAPHPQPLQRQMNESVAPQQLAPPVTSTPVIQVSQSPTSARPLHKDVVAPVKPKTVPSLYQAPFYRKPKSPVPVRRTSFDDPICQPLMRLPLVK